MNRFFHVFPSGKKRGIVKTEDDSTPLLDPFPLLKHYQRNVEEALKSSRCQQRNDGCFYPISPLQCFGVNATLAETTIICVSCAVVKAYPFLKATFGRPYVSSINYVYPHLLTIYFNQDAIAQGLINRFKEFRRDKSKPRTKLSTSTASHSKEKTPGITRPLEAPQLQV